MAYYFLLSPQLLAQQQLLPANQQQLLAQQIIQSQQLLHGEEPTPVRQDAIDLTEEVEERKYKPEPRHELYEEYQPQQHHSSSWAAQHQISQQYTTLDQNEIWHSESEPTTSDEIVIPEENISNYETVVESEEIIEETTEAENYEREQETFEPAPVKTIQKEKTLIDYIEKYPTKCGETFLSKNKQYKMKCHFCKQLFNDIVMYMEHIAENHFPYNIDVQDVKGDEGDAEKCGNIFMSHVCQFLFVCTVCNKPFEDFKLFSKHINDYHLNILLGHPKTFLDAFQLFAKKMEEKTDFVNENNVNKTSTKVFRGSRTLKDARENSAPVRSQPQKCDLCSYQCRTIKQLQKHSEMHIIPQSRAPQQPSYYATYNRQSDAEEARLAAEFILS